MRRLLSVFAVLCLMAAFIFAAGFNPFSAVGAPPANDSIRGKVHVQHGSAAGVYVVAESTGLDPAVRKAVVADNGGKFEITGLPDDDYNLWVRGNCFEDSDPITARPSKKSQQIHLQNGDAEWTVPNKDDWNHRWACSDITSSNVSGLEVAWTRDIAATTSYGAFASMPIIADGKMYIQDLNSNIAALDLETGQELWTIDYDEAVIGPNGLNLQDGVLYGVTRTTVFALDAADGSELWREDVLTDSRHFSIAPAVHDGRVYAGSITRANGGIIFALDAASGGTLWTFNTLLDPTVIPPNNPAGGVWYTPPVDLNGDVYYGTGNAYTTPRHNLENPDPILYTNSLLKLGGSSGSLEWYFQGVPNDFYDWDMQTAPLYIAEDEPIILGAGKMGYIYAFDPDDGTLMWKTSVGLHNGHDEDSLNALENPGSVVIEPPLEIAPGVYGGVETPMAYKDGVVYAAIANLATTLSDLDINYGGATGTFDFEGNTGEMVALDVSNGNILWTTDLPGMAFGAATISNDLVFTTSFDGQVFALSRSDGSIVWQDELPAVTNAPIVIAGDYLVTAASFPQDETGQAQLIVYKLGN